MEREEYWNLKRQPVRAVDLFRRSGGGAEAPDLLRSWIALVEEPRYLAFDTVHPGAVEVLSLWAARGLRLFVATLRRNQQTLEAQLERLGLRRLFERVVACNPSLGGEGKAAQAMCAATETDPRESIWVGDTEVDAIAATTLRCARLYLVTCGIRSSAYLRSLDVGQVVSDLPAVSEQLLRVER